jgi:energy-coupling factor transporter ATP-binding protein EcfA2
MKLNRSQLSLLLLAILALAIGLVTNVASGQIPESLKSHLWYSWPVLGVLVLIFLIVTWLTQDSPMPIPAFHFTLKGYYDALRKHYQTLDLDSLTPPQKEEYLQLELRSVFVEQDVRQNPPPLELPKEILEKLQNEGEIRLEDLPEGLTVDEIRASGQQYYENRPEQVIDVLTDEANRLTVILGDPGAGKSTLARYVMLSLINADGDKRIRSKFANWLPMLIELRTFNALREEGKCDTFLEFVEFLGKTEGWHLNQARLHEYLTGRGSIVLFDGLDEVFDAGDRARVSLSIAGFVDTYPKARVIVTSRIIGYHRKVLTDSGFTHYTLQDFDRQQVETFVTQWYALALSDRGEDAKSRQMRILRSFDQSSSIRQLAGNPMLLTIMAIIGKHQELPRERWKLYEHAASVLIEHWDVKRHLENLNVEAPFIGEDEKKELLRRLAFSMQAGGGGLKGNYVHREQLQGMFEEYLEARFRLSLDRVAIIARLMIEQLRQRNFILSLYGANVYGFVHRAFLEYFCASAFVYKFEKSREIAPQEMKEAVFGGHWNDETWHEVLRLICGMIDERFATDLIKYLTSNALETMKQPRTKDQSSLNLVLAILCLSEVRNSNLVTKAAILVLEAAIAYFAYIMKGGPSIHEIPIVPAAALIGSNWPGRESLSDILAKPGLFDDADESWYYTNAFANFTFSVGKGISNLQDRILGFAVHQNPNYRALAPRALAYGWHDDPQTVDLIVKCARDENQHVRWCAVQTLYYDFQENPVTLRVLKERAVSDEADSVRHITSVHLGHGWPADAEVFSILRGRVLDDVDDYVRREVLRRMIFEYKESEALCSLLKEVAEKDSSDEIRKLASGELAKRRASTLAE